MYFPTTWAQQAFDADEYQGNFVAPSPGQYTYTYRFSVNAGISYTYCDSDGAGRLPGLTFDPNLLGTLTVTP